MGRKCIESLCPFGNRNELNHNIAAIMQRSIRFPSWCSICRSSLTRHTASPILIHSDSVFIAFAFAMVFSRSRVISRETSLPKVLFPKPSKLSEFLCAIGKKLQWNSRKPSCGRSVYGVAMLAETHARTREFPRVTSYFPAASCWVFSFRDSVGLRPSKRIPDRIRSL